MIDPVAFECELNRHMLREPPAHLQPEGRHGELLMIEILLTLFPLGGRSHARSAVIEPEVEIGELHPNLSSQVQSLKPRCPSEVLLEPGRQPALVINRPIEPDRIPSLQALTRGESGPVEGGELGEAVAARGLEVAELDLHGIEL